MPRSVAALAALLALATSACQLRLAADIVVDAGLDGTFELVVAVDRELAQLLDEVGVDVLAGLDEVRRSAPQWTVHTEHDDRGWTLRLRTRFDGAEQFTQLTDELHAALDDDDARLFEDLRLRRLSGGPVAFDGAVGLVLPAAPGARGAGVAVDADDVHRILTERGEDLVRYDLRVTLPAPPRVHDADEVDGTTLIWQAPVGRLRPVAAVSEDPGVPALLTVMVGVVVAAGTAAGAAARRRHRRFTPAG